MPFQIEGSGIKGLYVIRPHIFTDDRGIYRKYFEKEVFTQSGISCRFTESSDIYSAKGALRGLHYQTEESQAKLIHVLAGALYDVALDLRPGSTTYGQYRAEVLRAEENVALFIPEGFAHGFIALEDDTIFSYQCTGRYVPASCGGIRWDDPELAIPWPLEEYHIQKVIMTEKDRTWPTLKEYEMVHETFRHKNSPGTNMEMPQSVHKETDPWPVEAGGGITT